MNRKDFKIDRKKANMQDLRKKEKENRKLQLELNQEKEKFNQMVVKYQKELNEMQAVKSSCFFCHIVEFSLQEKWVAPSLLKNTSSVSNTQGYRILVRQRTW